MPELLLARGHCVPPHPPTPARHPSTLLQIIPLLTDLRAGNMVGNVEALTQVAAEAAADIQRLQTEVLTDGNVKALRESVQTLTKTLQHIERITGVWVGVRARGCVWGGGGWEAGRVCTLGPRLHACLAGAHMVRGRCSCTLRFLHESSSGWG
jgi:hypothetical protein